MHAYIKALDMRNVSEQVVYVACGTKQLSEESSLLLLDIWSSHFCGIYITYLSSFLLDLYVPKVDNNLYGYFMISSSKLLHLDGLMKIERDDLLKILSW